MLLTRGRRLTGRLGLDVTAIVVFVLPGFAKLFPAHVAGLVPRELAIPLAVVEIAIGGMLLWPRWRRTAVPVATVYLLGAVAFTFLSLSQDAPSCGCFGGWVAVAPWARLAILGAGIAMLEIARPVHSAPATRGKTT